MKEHVLENFTVKFRKFSEKDARIEKANQIVLSSLTIIKGFLLFGFITQIALKREGSDYVAIPAVILAVSMILDWICYIRDHKSTQLKNIMMGGFLIVYAFLNLMGSADFVSLYAIPPLICCMLYYHTQFNRTIAIVSAIIILIHMARTYVTRGTIEQTQFMICAVTLLSLAFFYWSASVLKQFEHDTVHTMQDEQTRQAHMMKGILHTTDLTRDKIDATSERMIALKDSTTSVNRSLHEIAQGIQSTAESIQEQSVMTGEIREAVRIAEENTTEVVKSAQNSATQIEENSQRMELLHKQSEDIESVGIDVEKAMQELKEKAEEVAGITKVIFSISEQTNLLALNASIESARAGEAGKGFAVVADQIRELSEQTKKSTEQIEQIAEQLNSNADVTADLVEKSLSATMQQKDLIEQNAASFVQLRNHSDSLSERADNLEHEIKHLLHSNNRIVESITQLSAVSEEVTASTQEASDMSEHDLGELESVTISILDVQKTVDQLKQYHTEDSESAEQTD